MTDTQIARFQRNAGIALGPILFIIAILAILAAAIAAGSGSFNASTNAEGNRAKASAIIQIGENLKIGMDRLTMENGVLYNGWTTSPTNTSNNVDLFSPTGGGIAAPSVAMAADPTADQWYYPQTVVAGLGTWNATNGNTAQLAVLNVTQGVCQEINNRAIGINNIPAAADLGNFKTPPSSGNLANASALTNWPQTSGANLVNLYGKPVGCVNNNGASSGYFFYQVLYAQ